MKLDHPSMCAIEHSAGGFGMPDTPTSDEGTYVGPISLHNAIAVVCWSRIRRGHANLEWRFSTRGFALIRPIPGSTDPAHRLPFPSSTNHR